MGIDPPLTGWCRWRGALRWPSKKRRRPGRAPMNRAASPPNMALRQWEDVMPRTIGVLAAIGFAAVVHPATAADVTPERLLNTAKEPQNWLMVHRDYDNSRHSPLSGVDRANVKDLKLKFLFSI